MSSYRMSNRKKSEALVLRKKGRSYSEISKSLGIAKSTLSFWFNSLSISSKAKKRIRERAYKISSDALIKRNKQQTKIAADRANKIRIESASDIKRLSKSEIFFLGLALYWGEGYKKGADSSKWKCVDFANSDPDTVRFIMKFFQECCGVDISKIKAQIMLHSERDTERARRFWHQITRIPYSQFMSTTIIKRKTNSKSIHNTLNYGTIHIRIYSVEMFFKIIGWIDGLRNRIHQ
jgi:hypothetical protein